MWTVPWTGTETEGGTKDGDNNTDVGLRVLIELVGTNIYTITLCVYVSKNPESLSLVVLFTRQYRLLLNKYGLSISL